MICVGVCVGDGDFCIAVLLNKLIGSSCIKQDRPDNLWQQVLYTCLHSLRCTMYVMDGRGKRGDVIVWKVNTMEERRRSCIYCADDSIMQESCMYYITTTNEYWR